MDGDGVGPRDYGSPTGRSNFPRVGKLPVAVTLVSGAVVLSAAVDTRLAATGRLDARVATRVRRGGGERRAALGALRVGATGAGVVVAAAVGVGGCHRGRCRRGARPRRCGASRRGMGRGAARGGLDHRRRRGGVETALTSQALACLSYFFWTVRCCACALCYEKTKQAAKIKTPHQQLPSRARSKVKVKPAHQKQKETWFMDMGDRTLFPPLSAASVIDRTHRQHSNMLGLVSSGARNARRIAAVQLRAAGAWDRRTLAHR